jgi:hypothetical protein
MKMKDLFRFKISGSRFQHELFGTMLVETDFHEPISAHGRHFHDGAVTKGVVMHPLTDREFRE